MEKGLPLNRIANVTVTLSARAAQGRNFGSMLILGDSTVIPISERLRLYSSADDIGDDFGVDSQEYAAAVIWFSQQPQPTLVYVGRWAKTLATGETGSAESLLQAVNALLDWNSWYGLHLAVPVADYPSDTDIISVAAAIEAASVSRIFGVTSADSTILDAATTTDLASKLKAAKYSRTFIQYSTSSRYAALSSFARAFTVDGSNTTITLKFKQLPGVTYETLAPRRLTTWKRRTATFTCTTKTIQRFLSKALWQTAISSTSAMASTGCRTPCRRLTTTRSIRAQPKSPRPTPVPQPVSPTLSWCSIRLCKTVSLRRVNGLVARLASSIPATC
jgi:hypothetical protein